MNQIDKNSPGLSSPFLFEQKVCLFCLSNDQLEKILSVFLNQPLVENSTLLDTHERAPIDTNLINNQPQWLPKNAISKKGILSTGKFMGILINESSQAQKEALLKWHFKQRKFPNFSPSDTLNIKHIERPEETKEGYATSPSKYPAHKTVFIHDGSISKIYSCVAIRFTEKCPVGVYKDGKVIIQQKSIRSCVAACAAMLIEDRKKKCNVKSLTRSTPGNNKMLVHLLQNAGFNACGKQIKNRVDAFAGCISQYGSLACGIMDKEIGAHEILLDKIDYIFAVIRDPFHGWRIRIPAEKFLAITDPFPTVVFIT